MKIAHRRPQDTPHGHLVDACADGERHDNEDEGANVDENRVDCSDGGVNGDVRKVGKGSVGIDGGLRLG